MAFWTLVKRFGAWFVAHPLWAAIGGLALSLMAALAGGRWKDRKLARQDAALQKARVDASLEPGRVKKAVIEDKLDAAEKRAMEAQRAGQTARERQESIEQESHERAKRWPTR